LKTGNQRTKETTEENSACVASQTKDLGSSECSERKSKRLGEKRKMSQEKEKNDKGVKSNKSGKISSFRHGLEEPEGKKVLVQPRSDMLWLNMMNGSSSEKDKTLKDASQRDGNYKKHDHKNAMPLVASDFQDKSEKINSRPRKDEAMQLHTLTSHTINDGKKDKVTEAIDSVIKKARKYSLQTEGNEKLCKQTHTKSVKFNVGDNLSFPNKPETSIYDSQKITKDNNDSPKDTLPTNAEYKSTCQAVIGDNQAATNEDYFPTGNGVYVNRDQPNNTSSNNRKPKEPSNQHAPVVPDDDRHPAAGPRLTLLPKPDTLSHQVQAAVPTLTQHAVKVLSYSGQAVPMLPHMPPAPLASQPQTYQTLASTIIVQPGNGNVTSDSLAQAALPFQTDPIVQGPTQTQTNIQPRPLLQNSRGKGIQSTKFIPPATVSNITPMVPGTSSIVPSLKRETAPVNVSGRAVLLSLKEMVENGSIVPGKNVLSVHAKVCIHKIIFLWSQFLSFKFSFKLN